MQWKRQPVLPYIQGFSFSSSLKLCVLCVCAERAQGSSSTLEQGRGRGEESRCCSPRCRVLVPTRGIKAVQAVALTGNGRECGPKRWPGGRWTPAPVGAAAGRGARGQGVWRQQLLAHAHPHQLRWVGGADEVEAVGAEVVARWRKMTRAKMPRWGSWRCSWPPLRRSTTRRWAPRRPRSNLGVAGVPARRLRSSQAGEDSAAAPGAQCIRFKSGESEEDFTLRL